MSQRKRPSVTSGPASGYARSTQRIVEFSGRNGGGLISVEDMPDGTVKVEVYREDATVFVVASERTAGDAKQAARDA